MLGSTACRLPFMPAGEPQEAWVRVHAVNTLIGRRTTVIVTRHDRWAPHQRPLGGAKCTKENNGENPLNEDNLNY